MLVEAHVTLDPPGSLDITADRNLKGNVCSN